jgi:hypothetical protein
MKCETSILEIETILSRIKNHDINLQPDFQRGEVWSPSKKKKLIDSILRGWKIPPIHLVQGEYAVDEVLDGQQRLVAIRDFFNDKFEIDGHIEPVDESITKLTNMKYSNLPIEVQRLFRKYTIHFIRLTEYKPEEPAELFYRLNQPATLTSAEQRNAYIGKTREQIKKMVDLFIELGADRDSVGFSNSRLAYDEILSKFCYCIELKTLRKKISATDISEKYRNDIPFDNDTLYIAERVIKKYMNAMGYIRNRYNINSLKLSKATLYSWLIFIKSHSELDELDISNVMYKFEMSRDYLKGKVKDNLFERYSDWYKPLVRKYSFFEVMLNTYNQRSSMGSTDALSIIYRDIIINIFYSMINNTNDNLLNKSSNYFNEKQNMAIVLDEIYSKNEWGENF